MYCFLFAAVALPDWLANVDLWSAVIGAAIVLLGTKYPVAVDALRAILAYLRGSKPAPAAALTGAFDPSNPFPNHPILSKWLPVILQLLPMILPLLMTKHGTDDPVTALVAELAEQQRAATAPPVK